MGTRSFWRTVGLPALTVAGLMVAGNAVSAVTAHDAGVRLGEARAAEATGESALNLKELSFERGWFSQSLEMNFVTGWVRPDAEVRVTLTRPVFFLPWRVATQETRVRPDEVLSL